MRNYLVAGNWKMNGSNAANAELLDGVIAGMPRSDAVSLLVCPPFPYLAAVAGKLSGSGISLGAQNVSQHSSGAYTGETAPSMLKDVGCEYVIVGGLIPVLCVGETQGEREAGRTEAVIDEQMNAVLDDSGIEAFRLAVIAYEPVWAIGTGLTATPEQAQEVHGHIRGLLASKDQEVAAGVKILYGGSVKGDNAAGLFGKPDIDGGLIGGASLKSADFLAIAEAAASLN
jgi:triosephosphate isomerase